MKKKYDLKFKHEDRKLDIEEKNANGEFELKLEHDERKLHIDEKAMKHNGRILAIEEKNSDRKLAIEEKAMIIENGDIRKGEANSNG